MVEAHASTKHLHLPWFVLAIFINAHITKCIIHVYRPGRHTCASLGTGKTGVLRARARIQIICCVMLKDTGAPLYLLCDALLSLASPSSSRWFPEAKHNEANGVVNGQSVCSTSACVSHLSVSESKLDRSTATIVSWNASIQYNGTWLPTPPFHIDGTPVDWARRSWCTAFGQDESTTLGVDLPILRF